MSLLNDPRVLFAAERTLMAWNRTSLALIAFGFLVERSGLLLAVLAPTHTARTQFTFWLGSAFILLGALSALFGSRQYRVVLRSLEPSAFPPGYATQGGVIVNLVVATLGMMLIAGLYWNQF